MGEELVQMMFHISNPPTPLVTLDLIQGPERCLKLDSGLHQNDEISISRHIPSPQGEKSNTSLQDLLARHDCQKYCGELLELSGADAVNFGEGGFILRLDAGNLFQGAVGEDDIGRHTASPSKLGAFGFEAGEEFSLAFGEGFWRGFGSARFFLFFRKATSNKK